jgi:hypothetical protein
VDIDESEESEFQGRKLRQNLSKKKRGSLERHGSLPLNSAGATRVRKSDDNTVKDSVEDHVNALKAAGQDRDKFQAAYNDASKLKHADLAKVASGCHLGPEKMHKTKGHALKSLEAAFIRNARFENKLKKEDTQADRMNHMQGLDPQAHNRLSDTIRAKLGKSWTDDKLWTDGHRHRPKQERGASIHGGKWNATAGRPAPRESYLAQTARQRNETTSTPAINWR